MKEDREFYRTLRKSGVPFVDSHIMARKLAKGKSSEVFDYATKASWSKPGDSDYKWNEFYEELCSYNSLVLPNGFYLIHHSHEGLYVSDILPYFRSRIRS